MVLYFTDNTPASEVKKIKESAHVNAIKLYPAGATTNSDSGVSDMSKVYGVIEQLEEHQVPLLLHGEVTHNHVDIFDREKRFLDEVLAPLLRQFPKLKLVLEHITTSEAANFVLEQDRNVAATITPQHLLFNRNDMLVGGIKPHFYCLPILKRQTHQQTLLEVATSGNPKFSWEQIARRIQKMQKKMRVAVQDVIVRRLPLSCMLRHLIRWVKLNAWKVLPAILVQTSMACHVIPIPLPWLKKIK